MKELNLCSKKGEFQIRFLTIQQANPLYLNMCRHFRKWEKDFRLPKFAQDLYCSLKFGQKVKVSKEIQKPPPGWKSGILATRPLYSIFQSDICNFILLFEFLWVLLIKDVLFLVWRMEPAWSPTSFEIPTLFSCWPAGKNSGNFKTGQWWSWFYPLN